MYDYKGTRQKSTEELQKIRRETVDYSSSNVVRLPEPRDFYGEGMTPLSSFRATKSENKKFFKNS